MPCNRVARHDPRPCTPCTGLTWSLATVADFSSWKPPRWVNSLKGLKFWQAGSGCSLSNRRPKVPPPPPLLQSNGPVLWAATDQRGCPSVRPSRPARPRVSSACTTEPYIKTTPQRIPAISLQAPVQAWCWAAALSASLFCRFRFRFVLFILFVFRFAAANPNFVLRWWSFPQIIDYDYTVRFYEFFSSQKTLSQMFWSKQCICLLFLQLFFLVKHG